jgi:hypothetical protein
MLQGCVVTAISNDYAISPALVQLQVLVTIHDDIYLWKFSLIWICKATGHRIWVLTETDWMRPKRSDGEIQLRKK